MDSLRWQKIEEVFNQALALRIDERESFLKSACVDDTVLRTEIDSLLREVDESDHLLSESTFALGAELLSREYSESLTGQTLGTYKIVRPIGRGGMGEVYLAHDDRLRRQVAIKFLPKLLVEDKERARRFKHEARAASAISHPNVAHVYEIGEVEGRLFTAMEFIDGLTLRERLLRGDLKVGEAIDVATQVASAIAAAHAQGIIHRDIKPENIMIRSDGLVKVVDFGLAKLSTPLRAAATNSQDAQAAMRITRAVHTEPGLLLGTAIYMSPEQARGQNVDARTDLWSWGVVLYEMLTGKPPFNGATNSDVIAEILKSEPPLLRTGIPGFPKSVTLMLRRLLSKELDGRYATIADLLAELRELAREFEATGLLDLPLPLPEHMTGTMSEMPETARAVSELREGAHYPARPKAIITDLSSLPDTDADGVLTAGNFMRHPPKRRLNPLFLSLSIIGLAGLIVAAVVLLKSNLLFRKAATNSTGVLEIVHLTNDGRVMDAAISADARLLAFAPIESGKQSLRIRDLESGETWELLPPDPALCWGMRFTPNGQSLFYITTQPGSTINVLYRMPVRGGPSQKLVVNIDSPPGLSPDGTQIAFVRGYPGQHRDALLVANVDGSAERELFSRDHPDKFSFGGVAWSPDSKLIAVGASRTNETQVAVLGVPLTGATPIDLTPWQWITVRGLAWKDDGRTLLFSAQTPGSKALQIWRLSYPEKNLKRLSNDDKQYEGLTLGRNALVATDTYEVSDLWLANPDGSQRRLTTEGHEGADGLRVTSAGRIVYTEGEYEESHLWSMNLNGGDRKQLAKNSGFIPSPSGNGQLIAYVSTEGGGHHVWLVDIDGQNNRQLTFGEGESYPSLTPDGQTVVYTARAKARGTLWKIPAIGGQAVQLTFAGITLRPVVSPDGTKIACTFRTDETDRWKIAVLPFDGGEPIRTFALPYPYNQIIRWTPDSKALTYLDKVNGVHNVWRQPIDGSPPSKTTNFAEDLILHYDWLASEQQLVLSRGGRRRDIVLMKNVD